MTAWTPNLFTEPRHLEVYRKLLLSKFGWRGDVGTLRPFPQWQGFTRALGLGEDNPLSEAPTRLVGGYFYNFHNAVPSEFPLGDSTETQVLVPTVRSDDETTALEQAGFLAIPAYIESALVVETNLDETLRRTLGGHRWKNLRRMARQAGEHVQMTFYGEETLRRDPGLLEIASELHGENAKKYGHPVNLYDVETLEALLQSSLGPYLQVGIGRLGDGTPVQVVIALLDATRGHLFYLVQGMRPGCVPANINLYAASYLQLYRLGEAHGVRVYFLSRGLHEAKRRLGANHFFLLNHWIRPLAVDRPLVLQLQEKAQAAVVAPWLELPETMRRVS